MMELRMPLPSLNRREITIGTGYLVFQLFLLPALLVGLNGLLPVPMSVGALNFLFFVLNAGAVVLIFSRLLKKNLLRTLRDPKGVLKAALKGFGLYWLSMMALSVLTAAIASDFVNLNDSAISNISQEHFLLTCLGTIFLVPTTEEVLHRGLVFGALYPKSPAAAYLVSAAVFSSIHLLGYLGMYEPLHLVVAFLLYLPPGLILADSYRRSGSLVAPILIHTAVNALGILAMR